MFTRHPQRLEQVIMLRSAAYREARPNTQEWDLPSTVQRHDPAFCAHRVHTAIIAGDKLPAAEVAKKHRVEAEHTAKDYYHSMEKEARDQDRVDRKRLVGAELRTRFESRMAKAHAAKRKRVQEKKQLDLKYPVMDMPGSAKEKGEQAGAGKFEDENEWVKVDEAIDQADDEVYEEWALVEQA